MVKIEIGHHLLDGDSFLQSIGKEDEWKAEDREDCIRFRTFLREMLNDSYLLF